MLKIVTFVYVDLYVGYLFCVCVWVFVVVVIYEYTLVSRIVFLQR